MITTVSQSVARLLSHVSEKCSRRRTTILYSSATDEWKKKPKDGKRNLHHGGRFEPDQRLKGSLLPFDASSIVCGCDGAKNFIESLLIVDANVSNVGRGHSFAAAHFHA